MRAAEAKRSREPPRSSRGAERFGRFAQVALPVAVFRTFTYGVPRPMESLEAGCRVWVRFGRRVLLGCVIEISHQRPELPPGTRVLPVLQSLDDRAVLSPALLGLGRWIADYYVAPPGEVFRSLLPPESPRADNVRYERTGKAETARLRAGSLKARVLAARESPQTLGALKRRLASQQVARALRALASEGYVRALAGGPGRSAPTVAAATMTPAGREALVSGKLRPNAARVLTLLATASDAVPLKTIRSELELTRGPFKSLAQRGYIRLIRQRVTRSPWARLRTPEQPERVLTEEQRQALQKIREALARGEFYPLVLHGVTGSGKTEVYLRAVEEALRVGRAALLLVPEIALTPRLAGLLRSRFGEKVAIVHSGLGVGERRDEWWRIRRGEARVVVGARAAVLAPLEHLGLVVVDEEHESSYKQEETPRYHARDTAIKRAQDERAVVVLGSATPSMSAYTHAVEGRYDLARLSERVGGKPLARVELIDMKEVVHEEGAETILSRPLREALGDRLEAGEQALVLLNRRGYASQLVCRRCGLAASCSECSVALTLHRRGELAVCHYCGLGRATPSRCDVCEGEYLKVRGYGTERVEEVIRELYPRVRVARMDRDTMRRKGSHEALLSRFASGQLDLLVGTQMLAKGHDFPDVTLVGVLAADAALGVPDFRAAERTFQLLTQVAGRAGRGDRPGEVLIQTYNPDHYSLPHACRQDYEGFYHEEMGFRRGLGYPPLVSLVNLTFEAAEMHGAMQVARRVAKALQQSKLEGVKVLGPAFAARSKVAGRYRCQVLVKLPRHRRRAVKSVLRGLLEDGEIQRAMRVDVDPYTLY